MDTASSSPIRQLNSPPSSSTSPTSSSSPILKSTSSIPSPVKEYPFNDSGIDADAGPPTSPFADPVWDDSGYLSSSYSPNIGLNEISSLLECFSLSDNDAFNGSNPTREFTPIGPIGQPPKQMSPPNAGFYNCNQNQNQAQSQEVSWASLSPTNIITVPRLETGSSLLGSSNFNPIQQQQQLNEQENLHSLLLNSQNNGFGLPQAVSEIWNPLSPSSRSDSATATSPLATSNFSMLNNDAEQENKGVQLSNLNVLNDLNMLGGNLDEFDDAQKNYLIRVLQTQLLSTILSPTSLNNTSNSNPNVPNNYNYNNYAPQTANYMQAPMRQQMTDDNLDRATRFHREAAAGLSEAKCTWYGELPQSDHKNPSYSCKVFFGGLPWDISEEVLQKTFRPFGNMTVAWPKIPGAPTPKGFAYGIFENEYQVKTLLDSCTRDYTRGGGWFYKVSSKKNISKEVEVIPWALCDANYVFCLNPKIDPKKTIFVGAIHGVINAEGLGKIMNQLFKGVVYAGIDTDQNKYPIGSARITFNNMKSYKKAVSAGFVEVRSQRFNKTIQLDPYLEDSVVCSNCNLQIGPYFCRTCFVYYCNSCYKIRHTGYEFVSHRPMTRKTNRAQNTPSSIMPSLFHGHHQSKQGCFNNHNGNSGYRSNHYNNQYNNGGNGNGTGGYPRNNFGQMQQMHGGYNGNGYNCNGGMNNPYSTHGQGQCQGGGNNYMM